MYSNDETFGSTLPPGVTQQMIDDAASDPLPTRAERQALLADQQEIDLLLEEIEQSEDAERFDGMS